MQNGRQQEKGLRITPAEMRVFSSERGRKALLQPPNCGKKPLSWPDGCCNLIGG
jgi:hypothetical protein